MQIAPEQGQFMALLVQLMGARRTLEVGVFTGYSSLAVALALPADGSIVACDISEEYTAVARRYWKEAGVDHMIDLRFGPALETLNELLAGGQRGRFDFAFIDADKTQLRKLLRMRPRTDASRRPDHGRQRFVVGHGRRSGENQEPDTIAIRAFNRKLHADSRVALSMSRSATVVTLA